MFFVGVPREAETPGTGHLERILKLRLGLTDDLLMRDDDEPVA